MSQTAVLFATDRLCAVVAASTSRVMLRQMHAVARSSSCCELRLDWLTGRGELRGLLAKLPSALRRMRNRQKLTVIATLRHKEAGGRFDGSSAEQLHYLHQAASAGCDWSDLEIETAERLSPAERASFQQAGVRLLISLHDFRRTPPNLRPAIRRLEHVARLEQPPAAIKIATVCRTLHDTTRLLALAHGRKSLVVVPMGEAGLPGRILALRAGSALAYGTTGVTTAPGQLSIEQMHIAYRAAELGRGARVYGIIGYPLAHSLSPAVHNAGYLARGVAAVFVPIPLKRLGELLGAIAPLGLAGFSVTLPHKQNMMRHLDACDSLAARIGAVNTVVVRRGGKLYGYNTDYLGIRRALEPRLKLAGSRALILGAGGAARAAAFALADAGAAVFISSRRLARARELARDVAAHAKPPAHHRPSVQALRRAEFRRSHFDLIINATPVGMEGSGQQAGASALRGAELHCRWLMDMVYRPLHTPLLKLARRRGIQTISGLEMFLAQAAAQWEIWQRTPAPMAAMRRAALQELAPRRPSARH